MSGNDSGGADGGIASTLRHGIQQRVFSGAAWSTGTAHGADDSGVVGTLAWDGPSVDRDSWWDLASVTKPIVALAVMSLVDSGELTLDDPIAEHLPDYRGGDKAELTVRQLLTHTSGLPGQVPMYQWCASRAAMLDGIRELPLRFPAGADVEYSSQGFIVLGLIAEAVSGAPLEVVLRERVTGPAGMGRTRFLLPAADQSSAAATEQCPWRGRLVHGTVHDENAEVLGGVAAHAGLFASLGDLELLARQLCRGALGEPIPFLSPAALAVMTAPATDRLPLRRCLAWQGRDAQLSPAGDLAGPNTYGHTGFTGTSLWVDPDAGRYVVLLTNRVHPSREGVGIARIRRLVHNVGFGASAGPAVLVRGQ